MTIISRNYGCDNSSGNTTTEMTVSANQDVTISNKVGFTDFTDGGRSYAVLSGALGQELVEVTAISGNTVTVGRRALNGTAQPWPTGTLIEERVNTEAVREMAFTMHNTEQEAQNASNVDNDFCLHVAEEGS